MSDTVKIIGPFDSRELVVDGWTVPLINVVETTGGIVHFTLDHRLGFDCEAKDFEPFADFIAVALVTSRKRRRKGCGRSFRTVLSHRAASKRSEMFGYVRENRGRAQDKRGDLA